VDQIIEVGAVYPVKSKIRLRICSHLHALCPPYGGHTILTRFGL
jgi:hypothetical protein